MQSEKSTYTDRYDEKKIQYCISAADVCNKLRVVPTNWERSRFIFSLVRIIMCSKTGTCFILHYQRTRWICLISSVSRLSVARPVAKLCTLRHLVSVWSRSHVCVERKGGVREKESPTPENVARHVILGIIFEKNTNWFIFLSWRRWDGVAGAPRYPE